ncbi:Pom152p SCDLUD_002425 [Saccharomycodes ludwigii]|uniref:Pom152p n=1 Tax=Saccharomycodes ludwigii TaxID=36035 RepID=UPI001E882B25|nr:hypothetical protein SCDLUD_002425 [Saccharomycodes ludwigii]KAH3900963.1 hypothetical protein SCDLUD_002425 [Saccharomycodes ludwigii]
MSYRNNPNNIFDNVGDSFSPYGRRRWKDTPKFTKTTPQDPETPILLGLKPQQPNPTTSTKYNTNNNNILNNTNEQQRGNEPPITRKHPRDTLIPTNILDVGSQRTLVFIIWSIIQAYKFYDLIIMKTISPVKITRTGFLIKYALLDSLFWYSLPAFNIPKLIFKPVVTYIFIFLSILFNSLISNDKMLPILTLLLHTWSTLNPKKVSLTGDTVYYKNVLDTSSHFKGRHTIKILPENTALFNPFHENFCFNSVVNVMTTVPIRMNSTYDIDFLQLEYRDLYTNEKSYVDFHKKELKKITGKKKLEMLIKDELDPSSATNIEYYLLNLNKPGFYQLKKVVDNKSFELKLYKSHMVIPECPKVTILQNNVGNDNTKFDRCIGSFDNVTIRVTGVPPLKLEYSKQVGGEDLVKIDDSNLQPKSLGNSPLLASDVLLLNKFNNKYIDDLKWARNYNVDINLLSIAEQQGTHGYHIIKVVDGFGNVIEKQTLELLTADNPNLLDYEYQVHDTPRVTFDEKINGKASTKRSLLIKMDNFNSNHLTQEDGPFKASLLYKPEADGKFKKFEHAFTSSEGTEILVDEAGTYILESVSSRYCPGIVLGENNVVITKPVAPKVQVRSTPIEDKCVGQVGLNFDLTFSGVPPFTVYTNIYKVDKLSGKRSLYNKVKQYSSGIRYQYTYTPVVEGDYEIVFTDISNQIFPEKLPLLPLKDYNFKTSMRVKPDVKIVNNNNNNNNNNNRRKICLNSNSIIPIVLKGEAPFAINYDIIETFSNNRKSFELLDVLDDHIEITTPEFNVGGNYILSIASITDKTGCTVLLSGKEVSFDVRRVVPKAEFNILQNGGNSVIIKEGSSYKLPLRLTGNAPFRVVYEHYKDGTLLGRKTARFASNVNPELTFTDRGIYKLISMEDNECQGTIVGGEQTFEISYLPLPKLRVLDDSNKISKVNSYNYIKDGVCQGFEDLVEMYIDGLAPFVVCYDVISPSGKIQKQKIQVTTNYASIRLLNDEPGEYQVLIRNVYDMNYNEEDIKKLSINPREIQVVQVVHKLPSIRFVNNNKKFRTCLANLYNAKNLLDPIQLTAVSGTGPYTITFRIYHESSGRTEYQTFSNIRREQGLQFQYEELYRKLSMGSHIITIDKIVEMDTGCIGEDTSNSRITLYITDVPKITLLESHLEYCVGDYVAYQLNGISPFEIRYQFNDVKLKTIENTNQFVRLASESGEISINSIQDASSKCLVNFTNPEMSAQYEALKLKIHPIPSVTVSKGEYLEEDIHEGDQAEVIFTFEGTPPFSLTYVRIEEDNGAIIQNKRSTEKMTLKRNSVNKKMGNIDKRNVIETHRVTDIYSYEYRVVTSLQGTYEAIEIFDAYCFARNDAYFQSQI